MWHFQKSTPDWPEVIPGDPPLCVKGIDCGDLLVRAKQENPNTFTILRHWGFHEVFGGTWDQNCQRARDFFATFIDGTFDTEFAPHVDAIEEFNEYLANSQTPEEVAERLLWAEAAAWVWKYEYRTQPDYTHIKLVICNTAVGNIIDQGFAQIALEYDCLLGYHPYTLYENGDRWDGDFLNLSGLFATLEDALWPDYVKPTWVFTEAGPFRNAIDGWRHPGCLGGDVNAYVAAVRAWIEDVKGTPAYQEGRVIGFNLFNTGDPDGTWEWYETTINEMRPLAAMIRSEWQPPDDEPPLPPGPGGNVQVVNCTRLNARTAPDPLADATRITSVPVGSVWRWTGERAIGTDGDEWWKLILGWHRDYLDGVIYAWGHSYFLSLLGGMKVVDIVDSLPKHPTKKYSTRDLGAITTHVVHHSATDPNITPEQIARYHVESLGWPGIGYHFVIVPDGTIYQTNRLNTISYHVGNNNGYTVGTCLVGNFTLYAPTDKQVQSLSWLQNSWMPQQVGDKLPLFGHKEMPGQQTACPGYKWNWRDI